MNKHQILLIQIGICLLLCGCKKPTPLSDSVLELNDYQKKVLNNLYVDIDEIYNRTEMYLSSYGIPKFDSGKVTVFKKNNGKYAPASSFLLKDSMLVNFGRPDLNNPILYDDNGNLLQIQKMTFTYEGDNVKASNNGVANWEFEHESNCVIRRYISRTSSFHETKKFCYNQDKRLMLFEWFNNSDSTTTFEYFKYDEGMLIGKVHLEIKDLDTLINQRVVTESVENGLITKYQTGVDQVIVGRDTFQVSYPFENEYFLIDEDPLTILKKVLEFDKLKEEIIFTFNENGHLTEYYTKGDNRRKYRVKYEYEKL